MLSSRLRSRFFLSLRFAYRRHFHVIIMLSVSRFVCLRVFTFNVSVCICGGIHADVIETVLLFSEAVFTYVVHQIVVWCFTLLFIRLSSGALHFNSFALMASHRVELCRESAVTPCSLAQ